MFLEIEISLDGERVQKLARKIAFTTAPPDYDGFGTFTLYYNMPGFYAGAGKEERVRMVAIAEEHFAWQEGRYCSGMYRLEVPETPPNGADYTILEMAEAIRVHMSCWVAGNKKGIDYMGITS